MYRYDSIPDDDGGILQRSISGALEYDSLHGGICSHLCDALPERLQLAASGSRSRCTPPSHDSNGKVWFERKPGIWRHGGAAHPFGDSVPAVQTCYGTP